MRTWSEFYNHVIAHPYPDPRIMAGLAVALAVEGFDRWRARR